MSNPNPVKQQRYSGQALSPRLKAKHPTYKPRAKREGEAAPRVVNTFASGANRHVSAKHLTARSGLAICS